MGRISRITTILLAGAALPMLAACGASDIASPGDNTVIGGGGTGTPTPTSPSVGPNQAPTGTIASISAQLNTLVQTQGFVDEGVIEFGATAASGTTAATPAVSGFRVIRLPSLIDKDTLLPYIPGVAYLIDGTVNVGIDLGGSSAGNSTGRSANLTVQAGAILFADNGVGAKMQRVTVGATGALTRTDRGSLSSATGPDYLIVNRGSKIFANGEAAKPVIFTARQNLEGVATDTGTANSQGLWGGLIMAGRAPISDCTTAGVAGGSADCFRIVEGTGTARYGGDVAADNSGTLRYVQIRYSGIAISEGNELQGLTPAGVGSDTIIDNVQVHNSADDGVEIFGGRVNAKHLVITGSDDDDLDTDVGYQGAVQFVLGIKRTDNGSSDPRSIEVDSSGNEDALPRQYLRLANYTFVNNLANSTASQEALYIRGGADATLVNGIVKTSTKACIDLDQSQTVRAADGTLAAPGPLQELGAPVFHSNYFDCPVAVNNDNETGNLTAAAVTALFTAGTNNVLVGNTALTSIFLPTGAAATNVAFNAATLNRTGESFLVTTTYIGAVKDATDNWYKGWTCTPSYVSNLGGLGNCTSIPTYS
ncbi:hypothetical protein LWE61_13230 [Sphingobium sufflavum]|uniref:hypothetical protein n=1 Tax=Sphingobium sufflavum TaxID=1129547 RepID=UPI001F3CA1A9|nr:hypothetical protein [Sphingobium sufflavum]MCE7797510.1 hypothetical protein [Sphingobium sufflavum]